MANTLTLKTKGGKDKVYKLADLDFINILCDLEDRGIDIYSMASQGGFGGGQSMHVVRTIFATLIGEDDMRKAGSILSEHVSNGGSLDEVFSAFGTMMNAGGFGESQENEAAPAAQTE